MMNFDNSYAALPDAFHAAVSPDKVRAPKLLAWNDALARELGLDLVTAGRIGPRSLVGKGERPGRNPKTGEEIPITARRVVTFRPGQKLKARVEAYSGEDALDAGESPEGGLPAIGEQV